MLASLSPSAEDADDEEEDGCEELLVRLPPSAGEDATQPSNSESRV